MSAEYPKVIQTGGIFVTVQDAADEARWMAKVPPAQLSVRQPEPVPVEEVVSEPAPVVAAPKKKKRVGKKK